MGRAGYVQRTKDEEPVTKSCQQKNKPEAAIRGRVRFPFPEALRRHHSLRRNVSGTASNEVREFCFHGASPFQPSTEEANQNYNTQGAARQLGRNGSSQSLVEVNGKLNKPRSAGVLGWVRVQNYISQRASGPGGTFFLGLDLRSRHRCGRW